MRRVCAVLVGVSILAVPTAARGDDVPPSVPPLRQFSLTVTGDILAHVSVNAKARIYGNKQTYDYAPMFTDIAPLIAGADLAICHLEGPIAPPRVKITGQPVFGSPAGIANSIAAVGYDRCSTASNHSLDKGTAGVFATINAFQAAGLRHAGTARSPEEAAPSWFDVKGVRVAHLSYSYNFNGRRLPKDKPWLANMIDPARILGDSAAVRAVGAEVVIVSLHWGSEYRSKPTAAQRTLANTLTASGLVDLIVGHHAHVVQPMEMINGKWVIFGLGNILSNQRPSTGCPAASQDGVVVRFTVTEQAGGGFSVSPPAVRATWVLPGPYTVLDVKTHLADLTLSKYVRNQLAASLKRTTKMVSAFLEP